MQKLTKKAALPNVVQMQLVNAYAAGIDIGDTIHAVAIPEGLDDKRVQVFGTVTCDLEAIADWLLKTRASLQWLCKVPGYTGSHCSACLIKKDWKFIW